MYKKILSLLLILFCLLGATNAQERKVSTNVSEYKTKLIAIAKKTSSISAAFKQIKSVSFMNNPQLSNGIFYYQQANKMRWEQQNPNPYILLINGDKIRIKDGGKEKKLGAANKMMGQINALMISLINGDIFNSKDFTSAYFENSNRFIVELTPKNKKLKSVFNTIELAFDKKTLRLKTLTFNEKSGDKSTMTFFNEKFNQSIANALFTTF